jgi:hypothetical protein
MSALPPKADMCGAAVHVRFGPIADIRSYGWNVRFVPIADMPLLTNATGSQELETKSYLSPAEDSLAVEELDHTGLDRGGLVVRDHHRCDDGVAVVVERN